MFTCVSCSPLCSATFDLGKSSKLKCVLKGQKLSRLLVSKIDRTQTSFRALFGIKARKLKNLTFSKIASLSVRRCSGLVNDGGHFISNFYPSPLWCRPQKWSPSLVPRLAFLVFRVDFFPPPTSLSLAIRMIYFPATDACRPGGVWSLGPFQRKQKRIFILRVWGKRDTFRFLSQPLPLFLARWIFKKLLFGTQRCYLLKPPAQSKMPSVSSLRIGKKESVNRE